MSNRALLYQAKGPVAVLTLNRPEVLNSINAQLAAELQAALELAENSDEIRCVLLTAAGKGFCAGQDIEELRGENAPTIRAILSTRLNPIAEKIRTSRLPYVCAVNGVAAGAGANLALNCDIVIASEEASFIQAFVQVGLIPDTGGTFLLPRLVGMARATALAMLGEKLSARDAERWGLIYQAASPDQFLAEAQQTAEKLAALPAQAIRSAKEAFNASWHNGYSEQLQLELDRQVALGKTADFQEGVAAFLEKRRPVFSGR